jgi:hypothetical protein
MTASRGFRRAGILVSIAAAVLTCSCRQASEQPEAGSQALEIAPEVGTVSPVSGTGRSQVFHVVVSHPAGEAAIADVQILFEEKMTPAASGACWIDINGALSVAVRKEDGSTWLPTVRLGSGGTAGNSRCGVRADEVKVEPKGAELAVTFTVTFAPTFKGAKKVYVIASTPRKHSGWHERGAWTVD